MQYAGGSGMIGRMHANSVPKFQFRGSIDDTRVYSRVLSLEEIEALLYEGRLKP